MKEIQAEGTKYVYFAQGDTLPIGTYKDMPVTGLDLFLTPFMQDQLLTSPDIRLVLIVFPFLGPSTAVYFLYWNDGHDLDLLDNKVERGIYTDDDFKNAVKTEYQKTICFTCECRWHTLIIPPGDPYLGAPGLLERKMALSTMNVCPNCGAGLGQMVVKILGPVTHDEDIAAEDR